MSYSYTASGGLRLSGCTGVVESTYLLYKFPEGSIAYLCKKARCGILEKVAIRRVKCTNIGSEIFPIYFDTFDAVYEEGDLCTHQQAVKFAKQFYLTKLAKTRAILERVCHR